jgi:general secretion pathway protein A
MYASFYKLSKEPFHITPDPEFFFLSPSHKEALGSIMYGVSGRKGFILITGEVGVGKTTVIRSYLEQVDRQKLKVVYLFNANVSFAGLLKTICQELGIVALSEDVFELVNQLYEVLIAEYKQGNSVVLIIDEAQNMPVETLENLRMLSNLETSTDKLIQIVFSGQPEFEEILNLRELRQLKQRIAVKATILPLSSEESLSYIRHRLAKVCSGNPSLFTQGALKRIVKQAHGIPRIINIICENAFITALGYQQKQITPGVVKEVIADFKGMRKQRLSKPAILVAGVLLIVIFAGLFFYTQQQDAFPVINKQPIATVPTSIDHRALTGPVVLNVAQGLDSASRPAKLSREMGGRQNALNSAIVRIVKKGDTLSGLAEEVYGFSSKELIMSIKDRNRNVYNVNRIAVGEQIIFPEREKKRGKPDE